MRIRSTLVAFTLAAITASPSSASMGGGSPAPSAPSSTNTPMAGAQPLTPRQEAERLYGDAYDDIAKAKAELADGKGKNATKRFRRALERAKHAVELDSMYFEAWNLIGYASRKLDDRPGAVVAYGRSLRIKPDYAPAREYLGEAYVEMGEPARAREQLAWLERLSKADEAKNLKGQIEAWETAHPAGATPAAAPADSAASASGSSGR
jgi:tetratricopeptide (TPR) repeat protein